ncbi:MAG TPA: hypothetical protein DD473_13755 [Planctomycetaceae bacterium]|nr:hypothetical protein [Planctomycetaceae bacterium]
MNAMRIVALCWLIVIAALVGCESGVPVGSGFEHSTLQGSNQHESDLFIESNNYPQEFGFGGSKGAFLDSLVTLDGVLKGQSILDKSGVNYNQSPQKGPEPITLVVDHTSISVLAADREIAQWLIGQSGKRVRLKGKRFSVVVHGKGPTSGQAGYSGPTPSHRLDIITVYECQLISE